LDSRQAECDNKRRAIGGKLIARLLQASVPTPGHAAGILLPHTALLYRNSRFALLKSI